jgi:ferrochelatase
MSKKAVLLLNLGSPDSTKVGDVRRYLKEFLTDPRVIDSPFRSIVVNLFILPFRPRRTAKAYRKVWRPEGSPLIVISNQQRESLEKKVDVPVALAMRYGQPTIADVIAKLVEQNVDDLYVMPLYPQYAMSSYETVAVKVNEEVDKQGGTIRTTLLPPFYNDPDYIDALIQNAKPYLKKDYDKIIFSFHGLPERHIRKADPSHSHCLNTPDCCTRSNLAHATCYRHQCFKTVESFVEHTQIPEDKYCITFQSRLGRDPWLQPFTDETIKQLGQSGVKKILILCPAFVADCLETLEEIAIEGKKLFLESGGEDLDIIPCLNDHPAFINFLVNKINGWNNKNKA